MLKGMKLSTRYTNRLAELTTRKPARSLGD